MNETQLVMYDEDFRKVLAVIHKLVRDANAKGIFVVDRNGQLIGEVGEMRGIDTRIRQAPGADHPGDPRKRPHCLNESRGCLHRPWHRAR